MSVARFSVRQVVLVNLLFFVLMLTGVVAYMRTPIEFFPDLSFNTAIITTVWTGASPEEVERLVTVRIEEEIENIPGIKSMRSTSASGVSSVGVEWTEDLSGVEYESALNDLRAAIDRVIDLPSDAEEPLLRELSMSEVFPSIRLAVVDEGGLGDVALQEAATAVQRRISSRPEVLNVTIRGKHDRELRILVDRDAAARHGLTVSEIAASIRDSNLNLPAGTFVSNRGETTLRAMGNYQSLEEIGATVVKVGADGAFVHLSEVATIEDGLERRRFLGRFNAQPALILDVAKAENADIREVADALGELMLVLPKHLPAGISLHKTLDTSRYLRAQMSVLRDNLFTGIALVMAILWFTIGFRNAGLTIIAIPFSFLVAIIFFPIFGLTINSVSLIGMLLVSGMLVDDAIIVLENIYRRIEEGDDLRTAVIEGTEEVMWPVIAAVGTTAAAFAPLLLVSGTAGQYFAIMPKTVILCLGASLLECLLILPAHYLDFGSRHPPGELPPVPEDASAVRRFFLGVARMSGRIHIFVDGGVDRARAGYLRLLDRALAQPGVFALLIVSVWFVSGGAALRLDVELFPIEFDSYFVALETPLDYSIDQTDAVMSAIESEVLDDLMGDVAQNYSTYIGSSLVGNHSQRSAPNLAMAYLTLTETEENRVHPEHAVLSTREILERYREDHADEIVNIRVPMPRMGAPVGRAIEARIQSNDYELNRQISRDMQVYLAELPGVFNIEDNLEDGPRELRILLDPDRALQYGLSFRDVALALRSANEGVLASTFRDPSSMGDRDIRVLLAKGDRQDESTLLETRIRTASGEMVRLGEVADVEFSRGYLQLRHRNGQRQVTVFADVDGELATSVTANTALATEFADVSTRHPEVSMVYGGEFEMTQRAFRDMISAVPIAVLLIYMILAAVFRSYLQPFVVITAIPFGLTGIVFGLALLGYSVSMMLLYAFVGLIGVVVNDSLVMVDFINRARREGKPLLEAVRNSGAARLRPILLTTFTTVLALLPMSLGLAGSSKSYGPFATGIAFGLIFAMFGTLFCVPIFYTLLIQSVDAGRSWIDARVAGGIGPQPHVDLDPDPDSSATESGSTTG